MSTHSENTAGTNDAGCDGEVWTGEMGADRGAQDLLALFVLDDIPNETVNTLLRENAARIKGDLTLWLADNYDTLPDYKRRSTLGTSFPIDTDWRSPFIGKTVPDAITFIRNAPKPPKPLSKRFCAVVTRKCLENELVLICKSLEDEIESDSDEDDSGNDIAINDEGSPILSSDRFMMQAEGGKGIRFSDGTERTEKQALQELGDDYDGIQVIPTPDDEVGMFHYGFERIEWKERYIAWREDQALL
ncbi:hypothetical protein WHR41_08246 [Cladosporium halotolerans]|uniref:Uncharacterized protein n=1 Tax=Cladosporium halotolerans TaxID=1052096 RepID=A0AB34KI07_9PEZI